MTVRARLPADLRSALAAYSVATTDAWARAVPDDARVLASLQLLSETPGYFLHGLLTALGDRFCQSICAAIPEVAHLLQGTRFQMLPARLGDNAGATGAASPSMEGRPPARVPK